MPDTLSPLQVSQARAARLLLLCATGFVPVIAACALFVGGQLVLNVLLSLGFVALGWLSTRSDAATSRLGATIAVIGQPIALTAVFAGHPWQVDMHMSFFAVLATLILLTDVRALIAGAAVIVVHHLSLSVVIPGLIYPSVGLWENVPRTLLHGAILGVETAALVGSVVIRLRLLADSDARQALLVATQGETIAAVARTEAALAEARIQTQRADAQREEAEAAQSRSVAESARAQEASRAQSEAEAREAQTRSSALAAQQAVVSALRSALGRLANGDLASTIPTAFPPEYEDLRRDFNLAVETLCSAIAEVTEVSGQIRGEAGAINAAAGDLAMRTERQAATLEETSAAMTDFTSSVKQSAKMAADAETQTSKARTQAVGSGVVVQRAVVSMQRIAESSQKIARINSVIDEIAFQTNLLALNAGVEAARAGEAGRGFAVVASEVRALSQRCSAAAKEITDLIEESGAQVKEGVSLVGQTGEALNQIIDSVAAAAEQVAAIARTATDQAQSLTEMNAAIGDLDRVTQQNASMFEETTAACQSLDTATRGMLDLVSAFRIANTKADAPAYRSQRRA